MKDPVGTDARLALYWTPLTDRRVIPVFGDLGHHGDGTAKMGLPGKRANVKSGGAENKLAEAGVLCTAHLFVFLIQKLTRFLN